MYIMLDIQTEVEIHSLSDLPKFKELMENINMKINKSQLAREMGVDRRTIDKYLNGFTPKKTKEKVSIVDAYYEVIAALLSDDSKQVFYYRRVLWQYLKEHHGLKCGASTFRRYIAQVPEFARYFTDKVRIPSPKGTVRYETEPGQQAQFDWKESIPFETKNGEKIEVNVAALVLGHSRFRVFHLALKKSQDILFSFLTETFEKIGGVPRELVTDNAKTIMDEPRTEYSSGKVNKRFAEFAKDFGFMVRPCIAGRPRTKGKVETQMKFLDEIHAYQGQLTLEELYLFIERLANRINQSFHQGTGKIPLFALEKEKSSLSPLPPERIRNSYRMKHHTVLVNASSMISYKANLYSVPTKYIGKKVEIQILDEHIWVYYNMECIAKHPLSLKKLNYRETDYKESLEISAPNYPDIDTLAKNNLKTIGEAYET
ncbi:IS21 family transposase [Ectobacillus antri]|uniref:IS21 family transposase n=4 Tax=Ectobacillus TaxID=2837502 RepID=A0ABT6HA37_9BACI|nr:IS21 family transposase [Ectobacillus antri]MDG4658637.1 IS21 family transposase [Ectobacillus antri]MDG5755673.1 IS21 family transposase [Ectobacillus antri]